MPFFFSEGDPLSDEIEARLKKLEDQSLTSVAAKTSTLLDAGQRVVAIVVGIVVATALAVITWSSMSTQIDANTKSIEALIEKDEKKTEREREMISILTRLELQLQHLEAK